jgi:hypothetical protein
MNKTYEPKTAEDQAQYEQAVQELVEEGKTVEQAEAQVQAWFSEDED